MKTENTLLVLWIIFGFIFVSAIDAILYLLITTYIFLLIEFGVPIEVMTPLVLISIFVLYISVVFLLIKQIRTNSKREGIILTKFPKKLSILLGLIVIVFPLIINKFVVLNAQLAAERFSDDDYNFLNFYGWTQTGLGISQLTAIIILFVYFIIKLPKTNVN